MKLAASLVCHECSETPAEPVLAGHYVYCPEHAPLRREDFRRSPTARCMTCKALAPTYRSECLPCFSDRTGLEVMP